MVRLPLLLKILDDIFIIIIRCRVCDVINIEISHDFLIKPFLYIIKKSGQGRKELLTWDKKHFSPYLNAFQ